MAVKKKAVKKKAAVKKSARAKQADFKIASGKVGFTVFTTVRAPMKKVWDAATKAVHLQKHFVDKVTGDYNEKFEPVIWYWKDYGEFPTYPVGYAPGQYLEFYWPQYGSEHLFSHVLFEFSEKRGVVTLKITERGWKTSQLTHAFGNCEGWSQFLMCLKAHVLFGKDLRTKKK